MSDIWRMLANSNPLKQWIQSRNNLFFGIITLRATTDFVGSIALIHKSTKNREAELAINLAKPFWNNGYGTEAMKFVIDHGFRSLALHRISLGVFATNVRAASVYKKL